TGREQPDRNAVARPAEHTDQPGDIERRRPGQYPADAGRVAGGQLDHHGGDQRTAADDRERDADSPHGPSLTCAAAAVKGGQPHRRLRAAPPPPRRPPPGWGADRRRTVPREGPPGGGRDVGGGGGW